jgi:hypothetical protein
MNCRMIGRALAVAVVLLAVCLPAAAQQGNPPGATKKHLHTAGTLGPAFALTLYQPKIFSATDSSLLFHKGPVRAWSDGGQLASETALAEIGMTPLDLPPLAYFTSNGSGPAPAPAKKQSANPNARPQDFEEDGKDFSDEMIGAPLNRVYYTGEVGFLYGQWSGKGSGDLLESYVWGQAGNDKFQITAGAAFEDWSGHGSRFHSFNLPR